MSSNAWLSLVGGLLMGAVGFWLLGLMLLSQSNLLIPIICGVVMFLFGWGATYGMLSHMDREEKIDEMLEDYKRARK